MLTIINLSYAQVNVNVNIGTPPPPVWGPVVTTEEYYFIPDINSYYDIRQSEFIYLTNGAWIRTKSLPRRYRSYDLNKGRIIVINDYHGRNPYSKYKIHKVKNYKKNNKDNEMEIFEDESNNGNNGNNGNHGNGKSKGNKKGKHD